MKENIINMLALYQSLHEKAQKIEEVFSGDGFSFLGYELDICFNIICDMADIPKDNTQEMLEKHGENWHLQEETCCRDWVDDILSKFISGKKNAQQTANSLIKGYVKTKIHTG